MLQVVLPKRADPTELKAVFEKVVFYFLFCVWYFPRFFVVVDPLFTYPACFSLCHPLLQYASIKNNDGSFMSPEDFVTQFLYAHTDIRLSEGATTLLAGVVDQKKDGSVFSLGCRHRASPLHWMRHLPSAVSKKVWLASHCIIPISHFLFSHSEDTFIQRNKF